MHHASLKPAAVKKFFFVCWKNNLLLLLILTIISVSEFSVFATSDNQTDMQALIDLKNRITHDPFGILDSWNESSSSHFCNWFGVKCRKTTSRVYSLYLGSQRLVGSLPPSLGNLTFLTELNLQNNSFHGLIPQELGRLLHLIRLNLSHNSFSGTIPTNLSSCVQLRFLNLKSNNLTGNIPHQLSSLTNLLHLRLAVNNLVGGIPTWIGNLSSLLVIHLSRNNLQGGIPPELSRLPHLEYLELYANNLSGIIPLPIFNISSIYFLSVTLNRLYGQLPTNVGLTLPNIQVFAGGVNKFTGPIPPSLTNASVLRLIDFAENELTGTIPPNFGSLQPRLFWMNFEFNKLGYGEAGADGFSFLKPLLNCTRLRTLALGNNGFLGELPNYISNLTVRLQVLTVGFNFIYGHIPSGIGNLKNMTVLSMEGNQLNGNLPDTLGDLQRLQILELERNHFSGAIPSSFGNLTSLTRLFVNENQLEGRIPSSLGNCQNLMALNLSWNNLAGSIPREIFGLTSLSISLAMAQNSLTGSIPDEVGNLVHLEELDISDNKFTGKIPTTVGSCRSLERLILKANLLRGSIPDSLERLKGLQIIDLSCNYLSGRFPEYLLKFSSLKKLNLSFNDFDGEVPSKGIFANATAVLVFGNPKICGGVPDMHLPKCSKIGRHPSRIFHTSSVLILIILSVIILLSGTLAVALIVKHRKQTSLVATFPKDWKSGVSYDEVLKSTNEFSNNNLIGSGSFGFVYKGVFHDGSSIAAVKVLNPQQRGTSKRFVDECQVLRNIRHRNLLKILTACSSVDHQGNDFKCLVFEFMSNGSLDQWLHPRDGEERQTKTLNLIQRLSIAIDVASAMEYLHQHCEIPIVHSDLKPNNILLDEEMIAHVGDFGLAKLLFGPSNDSHNHQSTSGRLKGTTGYIPPEYGMRGEVSTLGDVYSYGILLLEMLTGKRPTDDVFKEGLTINKFVEMALPENAMGIVDPLLLLGEEERNLTEATNNRFEGRPSTSNSDYQITFRRRIEECLTSVMLIGLSCSSQIPQDRTPMDVVVNRLHKIKDRFLASRERTRRRYR